MGQIAEQKPITLTNLIGLVGYSSSKISVTTIKSLPFCNPSQLTTRGLTLILKSMTFKPVDFLIQVLPLPF